MRKIFPIKPASRSNGGGAQSASGDASASRKERETITKQRRFSFQDKVEAVPANSASAHSLSHDDGAAARLKREHWCPVCPAPGADVSCATPPSGDENFAALEEIKTLVVAKNEAAELSFLHSHGLSHRTFSDTSSTSSSEVIKGVLKPLSWKGNEGPGPGPAQPRYNHNNSNVAPVPAPSARVQAPSMSAQERGDRRSSSRSKMLPAPPRSSSAPKVRHQSSHQADQQQQQQQLSSLRHSSMRLFKVPDRVFQAASSEEDRAEEAQPGGHEVVLLQRPLGRREKEQKPATSTNTANSLRARLQHRQAEGDGCRPDSPPADRSSSGSMHARSRSESEWLPSPAVSPRAVSSKPYSRYLSARTVAERLAKAIRGSTRSWSKDVKALVPASENAELNRKMGDGEITSRSQDGEQELEPEQSCSTGTTDSTTPRPPSAGGSASVEECEEQTLLVDSKTSQDWLDSSSDSRGGRSQTPESCGSKTGVERTALLAELGKTMESQLDSGRWRGNVSSPRLALALQQQDESNDNRLTPRLVTVLPDEAAKEKSKRLSDSLGAEDLDDKVRAAEEQVSMLAAEKALLEDQFELITEDSMEWRIKMQQRLRRMHEEKKRLAQDFAAEVKRRVTERAAAKDVLSLMKKEMESCMTVMEREKFETQITLEQELERRETTWGSRLEKIQVEENWLRDRLKGLEDEKGGLQKELANVNSKENALREKVNEFEQQMDGHRRRVEGAEKTIMDLRKSLDDSFKHARQTEADVELLRKACKEKEGENADLHKQVQRLHQLCQDHEKSVHGLRQGMKNAADKSDEDARVRRLQKELIRLSGVEQALRSELEASRGESTVLRRENKGLLERLRGDQRDVAVQMKKFDSDHRAEVERLQGQIVELGQDNNILAGKLRIVLREREEARDALKVSESCMNGVEEQNRSLQEDLRRERTRIQDMQKDLQEVQRLERRVESLAKQNQMLQSILAMKEKAVHATGEEVKERENQMRESQQTQAELRQSLQVSARQLYIMNERAEMMANKLLQQESQVAEARTECEQREEVIRGLEDNLSELAKQVDSQNARIHRLTGNNEELFRLYHEKGKEIEELQQKLLKEIEVKLEHEQEIDQLNENIRELKNEVKAQELNCKLLRDKLCSREADIEDSNKELSLLVQRRDWLQNELQQTRKMLADANRRLEILEQQVKEKDAKITMLQAQVEEQMKQLTIFKEEIPRITKERDNMQQEAEEMGREALRMSAEVEVLRRKVVQLDEDVMVKEGQISILRGNYEGSCD